MRPCLLLVSLVLAGCPRGGSPTPSDGGSDSHIPPCDTEAEALVRRAVRVTEQIVRTDAYADCLRTRLSERYAPCDGDPHVNGSDNERALRVQSAAVLSQDTFPVNACVPGALTLPDAIPPLERAAFAELVAFTLLERTARLCELDERREDGCREPYPSPLARVAGRIAHLRVHRAGYTHGVDVDAQNCQTGFVDHDGNGTLDDCARDGEPVVALDDADGDGIYDPASPLEVPMTRARFLCGIPDEDARHYLPEEMSAPAIADQCVQEILLRSSAACVPPEDQLTEGSLEEACGAGRLLLKARYFGANVCVCFPQEQDALGIFEVDPSNVIVEVGALEQASLASPTTRVVGVADVLDVVNEAGPREELLLHDHETLRVLGVSSEGALTELASLPEAPDFPALRVLGTVAVGATPGERLFARRALGEGALQELMLLDARDGFRVLASFPSGGGGLDGVGLQTLVYSAHTGNLSVADGEEMVFQSGSRLIVLGVDTAPVTRFRVRAHRAGGLANQPYATTDAIVGLVDLDGDGRASVLVRGEQHFNILGLTGAVGAESITEQVVLAYGDPWGSWMIAPGDEVVAILDVDGVAGDEIVIVRRSGSAATLAVLGVSGGDVSMRRVLYAGSTAGAFPVDATVRVDGAGDFNGDGRGDLVVRRLTASFTQVARKYVDLAVISGTATGSFEQSTRWGVFERRGTRTLRSDDFVAGAGRLRGGVRDAFVLAR